MVGVKLSDKQNSITIVSYVPIPSYHGLSYRITGYLSALSRSNVKSKLICPTNPSHVSENNKPLDTERYEVKVGNIQSSHMFLRFIRLIIFWLKSLPVLVRLQGNRKDVFQFQQIFCLPLMMFTKIILRRKVILDDFNILHRDYAFLPQRFLRIIDLLALQPADVIITASPVSYEFIRSERPHKKVYFMPNGVTPLLDSNFVPYQSETGTKTAVFIGGMGFHQNRLAISNIMKISRILYKMNTPLIIKIIGGPLNLVQHLLNSDLVKNGRVQFLGFVNKATLNSVYASTDIGLLPFFKETPMVGGQRTKAMEYLNHGLLVVAGPEGIGGLEKILPSKHYILCNNLTEFAKSLDEIVKALHEFDEIKISGMQIVKEYYSWDNLVRPILCEI